MSYIFRCAGISEFKILDLGLWFKLRKVDAGELWYFEKSRSFLVQVPRRRP